jgi:hydroxymethylbilane synthase
LARWQAEWVAGQLTARGVEVELVPITTQGDADQRDPIGKISSTPGVFTKELQRALLDRRIDLAVHSLKDLPTDVVPGLLLAAVPERESVRDVLISRAGQRFSELPKGAVIGTGSLRRRAQLLHARPDLQMKDIRGNVDTRLAKLRDGQFDAIVLAEAGLKRLGLAEQITEVLPEGLMLPAVGQGALGIEARADDADTRQALTALNHAATHQAVIAERSLLSTLLGGCLAPVGAFAQVLGDSVLNLQAVVLSYDGARRIAASAAAPLKDAASLGRQVADNLMSQGAAALIAAARQLA